MKAGRLVACAVAAFGMLAGCAAPDPAAEGNALVGDDARAEWTGCDGLTLSLEGPSALYGGSTPDGWEGTSPYNVVQVEAYRCERLSWGPFERGPVHIVQEWHSDFQEPDACRGASDIRAILQSIWFDDPDIAAYATEAHGMPAFAAGFSSRSDTTSWSVEWALPGHPASHVTFHDLPGSVNATSPGLVRRLYWDDGVGVGAMDFLERYSNDQALDSNTATGALQPPLLHGRAMPAPGFVAAANRQGEAHASASIVHFADTACLEPSS